MIEGLSFIPPWKQTGFYPKFFTTINLSVIYLESAFFIWIYSGSYTCFLGYYYFVGFLTLFTIIFCILLYATMYLYQKKASYRVSKLYLRICWISIIFSVYTKYFFFTWILYSFISQKGAMEMKKETCYLFYLSFF